MSTISLDFSTFEKQISVLYEAGSKWVEAGFARLQVILPGLSATDAKTMILGAAFFSAASDNLFVTSISTFLGAMFRDRIINLTGLAVELFNSQTSDVKYMILAVTIITLIFLKLVGHLAQVLRSIANVVVGLYTGVVFGKLIE